MSEMDKTNKIVEALDNVDKVMPSESFLLRMEQMAVAYKVKLSSYSKQTIFGIAASFLILFALNIYAVNKYNLENVESNETVSEDAYNLVPAKSIYE